MKFSSRLLRNYNYCARCYHVPVGKNMLLCLYLPVIFRIDLYQNYEKPCPA